MSLSLTLQCRNISSNRSDVTLHFPKLSPLKSPNFPLPLASCSSHIVLHRGSLKLPRGLSTVNNLRYRFRAHSSDGTVFGDNRDNLADSGFRLDSFLSAIESICLVSSAVISALFAVRRSIFGGLRDRVLVWVVLVMVCGVAAGSWIRGRQWRRFFCQSVKTGGRDLNLVERVEKLEEDLRSSASMIRTLSRQLEKLGIRFRVTRKTLKDPIAQTAALSQKNSEATRALAVQEDILEKELGEIQKVLLAMQEQQQKQLELILAIAKAGKLWDSEPKPSTAEKETKTNLIDNGKPIDTVQKTVRPSKKERA